MKAFTLAEIVVSVGILGILIAASFGLMDIGRRSFFTSETTVELRREIMQAFMKMERELRETRPSQVSLMGGSNSTNLTFKVPQDINGDGTVLDTLGNMEWSQNITYTLSGDQITRTASGVTAILARNVTALQFSRPTSPPSIIQVDLSVGKSSLLQRQQNDTGQIVIKMRN